MGDVLDKTTLTVTRRPGSRASGSWVPSATSSFTIDASRPQPVGPETIEMLPEGARTSARFIIYADDTQAKLYTVERDEEGYAADTVAYDGEDFVTTTTDDWNGRNLGYRAYILLMFAPDEKVPTP